ncbi:MAG: TolC family protein [Zoogloeaceae bacterium]|jgi:outer membrane protein TolC|nr:TolC family protein [Zoogloeaceae bacterium]
MNLNYVVGLAAGLACFAQEEALALSFDEAQSRAASAPEVLFGLANETAAAELSKAAGQLPDPRLVLSVDDLMREGDARYRLNDSKRMLGVMQEFPAASKREAERQKAAAARAESARMREYALLAARREVSLLWLELYFLTQKEALLQANADEIRRRQKTSVAALSGGGSPEAALGALLDQQRLDDSFDLLHRDLQLARARLARWIGPLAPAETASGALPVWAQNAPDAGADATVGSPPAAKPDAEITDAAIELRASQARVQMAQAELQMAQADKDANWSMEIGFGQDAMGQSMMMAKVGFSLPVFASARQNPRIAAARSRLAGVEADHLLRKAEFTRQREELLAEEAALSAMLRRLAEETLPLLNRGIALAEAAFSGGKGSADMLIEARERQIAAQLRLLDLEAARAAARARLYFLQQRGETHHE